MNRRRFLSSLNLFLLSILFIPKGIFKQKLLSAEPLIGSLDLHSFNTLCILAEHIFPDDHLSPGATSLGFNDFLCSQFKTTYYQEDIPVIVLLVRILDKEADIQRKMDFISCPKEFQTQLIERLYRSDQNNLFRHSFEKVIDITMEACFSDPKYGGNKNKASWRIMSNSIEEKWFHGCDCE